MLLMVVSPSAYITEPLTQIERLTVNAAVITTMVLYTLSGVFCASYPVN